MSVDEARSSKTVLLSNELLLGSRLDYAKSILYGVLAANIHKFQRMQNTIARITCRGLNNLGSQLICVKLPQPMWAVITRNLVKRRDLTDYMH